MNKCFAYLTVCLTLSAAPLFADETNANPSLVNTNVSITTNMTLTTNTSNNDMPHNFYHYVGLYSGMSTGIGITYRYFDDWGIQISLLPFTYYGTFTLNFGTVALKTIYNGEWSKFFLFLGGSVNYNSYSYSYLGGSSLSFGVGAGAGMEFYLFKNIAIDLMFGLGGNNLGRSGYYSSGYFGITVEGGIFYRF